jgi:predicted DCC family thiol-disulfide oxidoreductase YuxK
LQSSIGQELMNQYHIDPLKTDSVIYIKNGQAFIKSTAALKIAKQIGKGWQLLYIFNTIPKAVRDFFYDQFAKRRYILFGKKVECMIPSKEQRSKFIEDIN